MDARRQAYLDAMGIRVWVRRQSAPEPESAFVSDEQAPPVPDFEPMALDWDELAARVAVCEQCPQLVASRTRTVFGVGSHKAGLMVLGESPGADDDRRGEPFAGISGKLLDKMLRAAGFPRSAVYLATAVKCRPPDDRDPEPGEFSACVGYLRRQIELVNPAVILAVGQSAARSLLDTDRPEPRRGDVHRYLAADIPVIVTHAPVLLLRSPAEKRAVWNDLRLLKRVYKGANG
ncbi:uracil-DNA glycosylase [Thiohalomonas denitrificans]|nr:uracil-DNA glycosylase [Thiohalomonas denitrificans]